MVVYRPRESFNLPPPVGNDGSPRPLLAPQRPTITCHYPGAPLGVSYVDMTSDFKKRTYIANMQRYAQAAGKSYEYNFVLFLDGEIWEYAGDYLAAHSAGENSIAYGVQFVNGQDDLATDVQVEAFRWLRDVHLKGRGRLAADAATVPHKQMPGAVTACPGDRAVMPRLEELRQPWPTETPEPIPDDEEDDVIKWYVRCTDPTNRPEGLFCLDGAGATFVFASDPPGAEAMLSTPGLVEVTVSPAQYAELVRVARAGEAA